MTELYTQRGGKITLNLHPGQTQAWDSAARFTFVLAGSQGGKTSFVPWWLRREIKDRGPGDYLAVTANYDLFKLKFLPEMKRIFCDMFHWQYSASDRVIHTGEGDKLTRIILRSAEAAAGLESSTAKAAVLDECGLDNFTLTAWDAVQRRLAINQGRVLGATTPYNLGWLKTEVYDRWRKNDPDYRVVNFASMLNPAYPHAEGERLKRLWPDWKFQMFVMGNFSRPAGLIYSDLTPEQIIEPIALDPSWPRYVGIDPGPLHTAVVWMVQNPTTKVVYVCREYLEGERTTPEHVAAVKRLQAGENIYSYALGQKSEKQYRYDWQAAGISAKEPPIHEVDHGIDRVIALIKSKSFYVFNTCRGVIDQFGTYSRKMDANGQVLTEIKDKDNFHYLDAIRYGVLLLQSGRMSFGSV